MTIDSPHDSFIHQNAAINVVSGECQAEHYAGMDKDEVMEKRMKTSGGLTIMTLGGMNDDETVRF